MSIINKIKNWYNPYGYKYEEEITNYELKPKEDITAYELFRCKQQPITASSIKQYKKLLNEWYSGLDENCKRHLVSFKHKCSEMKHY